MIEFNRFKDGKIKALTMSYDDGTIFDERLIEIFDKYAIKGTFHLNSGLLGTHRRIKADEVKDLYKNHEVAIHGVLHKHLSHLPEQCMVEEILNDRKELEKLCGKPVFGMSYAYGDYNDNALRVLKNCGIVYSRTVKSTSWFNIPDNFLTWHPSCHHNSAPELADAFINTKYIGTLMYIWGHAYEFNDADNWGVIEDVCKKTSFRDDIWYATNIEIYEYVTALKSLRFSADGKTAVNPTALDLWFSVDDECVHIKPGETLCI